MRTRLLQSCFAVFPALFLVAFQFPSSRGVRSIYIAAVRDSGILTMCPDIGEVRLLAGASWKSDNNAMVQGTLIQFADSSQAEVRLPLPASSSKNPVVTLDRIAPDPEVKQRVEKIFLTRKDT